MATLDSRESPPSTTELDALDRSRRHMLIAVIATSTLMLLPQILRGIWGDSLPPMLSNVLILAGIAGALGSVIFMLRFHRFQMRVLDNPQLRQRLDDERVLEMRKEAVYRGWMVVVVAVGLGVAVAPFAELPDQVVLLTLMLLAVNAPIVFFLALDRD